MRILALPSLLAGAVFVLGGSAAVLVLPGVGRAGAATAPPVITCADAEKPQTIVRAPNRIDQTCAVIPTDFNGTGDTQGPPDIYSWLTFLAVNWPVNATTCMPSTAASILTAPPNPTWLTYLSSDDVFVATGTPLPWCGGPQLHGARRLTAAQVNAAMRARKIAHLPPAVRGLAQRYLAAHPTGTLLYLDHDTKSHALVAALRLQAALGVRTALHARAGVVSPAVLKEILDATNQPVVDQNGRFERFTISMNFDEYTYITGHRLWTIAGEKATGNLDFPTSKTPGATVGAMEFKAGWKVLVPGKDVASHFFTMPAIVCNQVTNAGLCVQPQQVTVGLVGLHIIHKTVRQPDWVWSTFEQVENVNDVSGNGSMAFSFYNPACAPAKCPPNVQTAPTPYIEVRSGGKRNAPTQVVAGVTPSPAVETLNAQFRGMLKNTPWSYYRLVSTQWTGGSGPQPSPNPAHLGVVQPFQLGNAVLETYVKPSPSRGSLYSCMYCHSLFMQNYYNNFTSDFSLIVDAKQ